MMRGRRIRALAVALQIIGMLRPAGAWADGGNALAMPVPAVPYGTLLEGAKSFDGTRVIFQGEAIGQIMERGTMAWVNVADQSGAIGVWMSTETARSIRMLGSYSCRGDELRIMGTFHRACGEHGGDMDIHAEAIALVQAGERVMHPFDDARLVTAVFLSLAAAGSLMLLRSRDRRRRELESDHSGAGKGSPSGT
ncbi:MAG TPA: hypothetical protein VMX33_04820 [bacterium]|nr:hypothetical protein [bacterium]